MSGFAEAVTTAKLPWEIDKTKDRLIQGTFSGDAGGRDRPLCGSVARHHELNETIVTPQPAAGQNFARL